MTEKEVDRGVQSKDDDADGLTPIKEEDDAMRRLYPLNCCQYF